jgi:general secretion pathway protein E
MDVAISSRNQEIGLEEVFKFDSKTYDLGIHDRIMLVDPDLNEKAKKFADKQHILVLKKSDIDMIVESSSNISPLKSAKAPFKFINKAELLQYLKRYGYTVEEKANIKGRSGVTHMIDIYAYLYDEVIYHTVDIGILNSDEEIGIDPVFLFDTKAYDIGAHDKIMIAMPRLSQEAKQFALHQRIKVVELDQ